jgi:saccharopine dehydrogenase (NAD+, L-lysine-forming)
MKVSVLGAAGTIAPAIVRDLAESEEVSSILLLDLDGDRAAVVAAEQGGGKASAAQADAREGLAEHLGGADALINSASYRINLDAMRACLEAGCHYLDLGGLYHVTAQQLELHGEFEAAGLLAVLGIGSSPGKTNQMAARAVAELTGNRPARGGGAEHAGRIDVIDVIAAGRDLDPPEGFAIPYALETLLDEITLPPVVVRDGKPVEIEPLTEGGEVHFGEEIGEGATIHTLHSELLTFPESFGCRESSFRLSLSPATLERLRELAAAGPDEVRRAAEQTVPQSNRTLSVHVVAARAGERVVRMRAVTPPHERWGLGGGIVSTASPAAAAVRLMARGAVDARGALPPERCLDADAMFAELATRGCRFELTRESPDEVTEVHSLAVIEEEAPA